jgi:hypothetical protein
VTFFKKSSWKYSGWVVGKKSSQKIQSKNPVGKILAGSDRKNLSEHLFDCNELVTIAENA